MLADQCHSVIGNLGRHLLRNMVGPKIHQKLTDVSADADKVMRIKSKHVPPTNQPGGILSPSPEAG
jgi:hypothetical protein